MQEAEEQDTCRICSAPAEPDQPLFHPCKCSGTIRYIHQDCLTTWLAHSKKKTCDVCKHPYAFTKVYAPDMPSSLPPILLVRRLVQGFFMFLLFLLRAIAVAAIWLGVLPWVTVWTWRMYFSMGESIAWWISDRPRPLSPESENNLFYTKLRFDPNLPPAKTVVGRFLQHPVWVALSADIFTGQIIASLIVLTFVAVFLLREWISQNARPGVFEDEEVPPEDPVPVPAPAPADPQAQPQNEQQQPADAAAAEVPFVLQNVEQPQINEPPAQHQPIQIPDNFEDQVMERRRLTELQANNLVPENAEDSDPWFKDAEEDRPIMQKKKKVRHPEEEQEVVGTRRKRDEKEQERHRRRQFHQRVQVAKNSARHLQQSRSVSPPSDSPVPSALLGKRPDFAFTFKAPSPSNQPTSSNEGLDDTHRPVHSHSPTPDEPKPSSSSSPFPPVSLQEPSKNIPFSLRTWDQPPSENNAFLPPYSESSSSTRPPTFEFGRSRSLEELPPLTNDSQSPVVFFDSSSHTDHDADHDHDIENEGEEDSNAGEGDDHDDVEYYDGYEPRKKTPEDYPNNLKPWAQETQAEQEEEVDEEHGHEDEEENLLEDEEPKVDREDYQNDKTLSDDDDDDDDDDEGGDAQDDAANAEEHARYFRPPTPGTAPVDSDSEGEGDDDLLHLEGNRHLLNNADDDDERPEDVPPGEEGIFDDEPAWEAFDVQVHQVDAAAVRPQQVPAVPPVPLGPPPLPPADPDAGLGGDLDDPDNVEDEMDGVLEAIGLRGPIYGVFQNAALMIFVLDTAIGLGVWIPFTIGKTTALLSLDFRRFLQVLHLPIRAMRIVTDPVVDFILWLLVDQMLPSVLKLLKTFFGVFFYLGSTSSGASQSSPPSLLQELSWKLYNTSTEYLAKPIAQWNAWILPANVTTETVHSNTTSALLDSIPDYLGFAEPYFAILGRELRLFATKAQALWIQFALGNTPADRIFAISLGYVVVGFFLALYLNILTVGNAKTAGAAVRSAVRQQLVVLKVASFIFIELIIFPLGCGIVLDLCTVWLFPEANVQSRAAFFVQAPLTAMFYHWVAGTMFMYSFAVLLSGCRTIMRPGAMWFIKDPQDQNSHPIRDILDRPTLTQLRKICVSGVMYSVVVLCVVSSVAALLVVGNRSILPFRWKNREPLSNIPVDLLFLHLVLPYTMHYFKPKRAVKDFATKVWKFLATRLRLTSYFFGGRHPQEEYTPKSFKDNLFRTDVFVFDEEHHILDGSFRRVPATDNLSLPREMRATVAVTADGEPVDDAAKELMAQQNAEAEKGKHNIKDDYMIVYLPPYFRYRIISFIFFLWMCGAAVFGVCIALPIQVGRSLFRVFTAREVHDGYSFVVGFYTIWMCYVVARAIDRLDKRRQRRSSDGPRANLYLLVIKRFLLWTAKTAYMIIGLGVVVPVFMAIVVDLYIILPIRLIFNPTMVPTLRIVDLWALGLLYAKIGWHVLRLWEPTRLTRDIQLVLTQGWTRPDPIRATRNIIAPIVLSSSMVILIPITLFLTVGTMFPNANLDTRTLYTQIYPTVFLLLLSLQVTRTLYGLMKKWSQQIRDKEFLVEMRLRNHEPGAESDEGPVSVVEGEQGFVPVENLL
ncbi:hypothetical protein BJ165DRAFT_734901 [Panaeolus papilionaceus]|nr:hypothetical protein BJ165DRAFT_734901 [Panaeolus papilionaceus]